MTLFEPIVCTKDLNFEFWPVPNDCNRNTFFIFFVEKTSNRNLCPLWLYIGLNISERLVSAETNVHVFISPFLSFFFFFSTWTVNLLCRDKNYCLCTVAVLFTYCSSTVHVLKMSPTVLFTHLKIILLQCFQFSVFSFSNNKLNPNGPLMIFHVVGSVGLLNVTYIAINFCDRLWCFVH